MSLSQALGRIEEALTDLSLRDRWGDPIIGLQAVSVVWGVDPEKWDQAEALLEKQEITAEEYETRILEIIERFRKQRTWMKLDQILGNAKINGSELNQ